MASFTFQFAEEDLEFELAPGLWWPQHMTGTAEVSCSGSDVEDWWLDEVTLDVAGGKKVIDCRSDPILFAAFEKSIQRYDDKGAISDELREAYWSDAETIHDPEPNYSPIQI